MSVKVTLLSVLIILFSLVYCEDIATAINDDTAGLSSNVDMSKDTVKSVSNDLSNIDNLVDNKLKNAEDNIDNKLNKAKDLTTNNINNAQKEVSNNIENAKNVVNNELKDAKNIISNKIDADIAVENKDANMDTDANKVADAELNDNNAAVVSDSAVAMPIDNSMNDVNKAPVKHGFPRWLKLTMLCIILIGIYVCLRSRDGKRGYSKLLYSKTTKYGGINADNESQFYGTTTEYEV